MAIISLTPDHATELVWGLGFSHIRVKEDLLPLGERILIVRLSAIGDTALTLPLLFGLREHLPGAHIGWVVGEMAAPLLEGLPELSRVHVWRNRERTPAGLWRLVRELKGEGYRLSIDPQGLTISALLPFLAGIPERAGFVPGPLETRELAPLFINRKIEVPQRITHVSDRCLRLARALGRAAPGRPAVRLGAFPAATRRVRDWWRSRDLGEKTLLLGIGAGWPTKIWSPREIAALIREAGRVGYRSMVLWGPQEQGRLEEWRKPLGNEAEWAPATDLREMIALLRLADRYAGPDSAPLHLAWLLGKPTFSWFGASDPARSGPYGDGHSHVARGPHNYRRHRFARSGLQTLKAEEALAAFRNWLAQPVEPT